MFNLVLAFQSKCSWFVPLTLHQVHVILYWHYCQCHDLALVTNPPSSPCDTLLTLLSVSWSGSSYQPSIKSMWYFIDITVSVMTPLLFFKKHFFFLSDRYSSQGLFSKAIYQKGCSLYCICLNACINYTINQLLYQIQSINVDQVPSGLLVLPAPVQQLVYYCKSLYHRSTFKQNGSCVEESGLTC